MRKRLLIALLLPLPLSAHDDAALQERIEQLEQRLRVLEQYHAVPEAVSRSAAVPADRQQEAGYALASYWLGKQPAFTSHSSPPLAQGKVKLDEEFTLRPEAFGVAEEGGLFSGQLDPSLNPVASLALEGVLKPGAGGDYTLVIRPTPPREVGGSGNVEMAIRVYLDGDEIFTRPYSSSLGPSRVSLKLPDGGGAFRMEVVARSPGFGPSPTRSRLFVGLQADGSVRAEPLGRFLYPPSP